MDEQGTKWFKRLKGIFYSSFRKIRHTSRNVQTELSTLMEARRIQVSKLKDATEEEKDEVKRKILELEDEICEYVAEANRNKVVDNFKELANPEGMIQTNKMWSLKRKVFPKNKESLPFAKKDCDGRIITAQSELKKLYLDTFVHRLRHRPANPNYQYLITLKEELCFRRIAYCKKKSTKPWTLTQMRSILKKLKTNKSRDPHGLVNELFKEGVIGKDMEDSLLMLLNKVKKEISFPAFMELVNIVAIYKGKGQKMDLNNDRGIFIVNIFRAILMKMIYQDEYDKIDKSMSDSNVGARKRKNIRNHIFILNGIIKEAMIKKKAGIDIIIVDYKQCFDGLWLEESMNDLFEAGIQDSSLATIYEANSTNKVAVKTPFGETERKTVEKIVLQGEVFGPLECSVSVDTFGKECLKTQKHLYYYKGEVGVPPLAMVDDVACVAECGVQSVAINAFINAKTRTKKLQFGVDKCHQLHFGRENKLCPDLFIDSWEVKKVDSAKTGFENLVDEMSEPHKLDLMEQEKYLGDIVSTTGKNKENILARKDKSKGIIKQIGTILDDICFGPFQFEVALILRDSLLLSSILVNSEAWYDLTEEDIETLEKADEELLRRVLEAPISTPKCMLYLETGCKPLRFIIMSRRLMFYHYILNEDEDSLISKFYHSQAKQPIKGDWSTTVMDDLEALDIVLTAEQIKMSSQNQFRTLVNNSVEKKALEYLNKEKERKSKVLHISFNELKIQKYLEPSKISNELRKFTFLARTRMLDVEENFKKGNKQMTKPCPVCEVKDTRDSQEHLMFCQSLMEDNQPVKSVISYENLFEENFEKQIEVSQILQSNFKKRKILLKKKKR